MRNLVLLQSVEFDVGSNCVQPNCFVVDALSNVGYFANDSVIVGVDLDTKEVLCYHSIDVSDGKIVDIASDDDVGEVCIILEHGDIIVWNPKSTQVEKIGYCDQGLVAMKWSPDQELIAFITGSENLIMMTREFDPIIEVPLHPEEFGEEKPVNVGWGKKETQFHGSQGKPQAEDLKAKERSAVLPWDDLKPRISWRGDGQCFAVSSVQSTTGIRKIRIWSREGVLQSTNEALVGLEQALSWRPSGNLIVSTQRKPNKHDVIFFEKNGLCHGEFTLPFSKDEMKVMELKWNRDSDVLAVWLENKQDKNLSPVSYVQLWITNNYHWYLKQELRYPHKDTGGVSSMHWDQESSLKFRVISKNGNYYHYVWTYAVNSSEGNTIENHSTVAVIDGSNLLLTSFQHMIVPPPMSGSLLKLPSSILQVVFGTMESCNDIALILSDGTMGIKRENKDPIICRVISEKDTTSVQPDKWRHLTWIDKTKLFAVTTENNLLEIEVSDEDNKMQHLAIRHCLVFDGMVVRVSKSSKHGSLILEDSFGKFFRYVTSSKLSDTTEPQLIPFLTSNNGHLKVPSVCTTIAVANSNNKEYAVGLSDFFAFYINDTKVASNCTSFAIHEDFILLTTHQHTCRCISLANLEDVTPLADNNAHDESIRRVERGAKIVSAVVNDTKVILQMPRGNLETIHPRALVVSKLRHLFDSLRYGEAFSIMRKHRINTNLMMDHNPELFLRNVNVFVTQTKSSDNINLFLADLKDEDVTTTLYAPFYNSQKETRDKCSNKVDRACLAVREALVSFDENSFLHSILTTYAKQSTPDLGTVLRKIKSLKVIESTISFYELMNLLTFAQTYHELSMKDDEASNASNGKHSVADKALKYILYLIDVNNLYDVALGMYDFDIVIMVASFSHKDPKEYLPFLNHLKTLEENYQKFTIDKHLKRHVKALSHIVKCGEEQFDECLSFIEEHYLHSEALMLFKDGSQQHKDISKSYGNYLMSKKKYNEAGIVFWRCQSHEEALKAFISDTNWSAAICQAKLLNYTQQQTITLANELIQTFSYFLEIHRGIGLSPDIIIPEGSSINSEGSGGNNCYTGIHRYTAKLISNRSYTDAAYIYEHILKDIEQAAVTLIEGCKWQEVIFMLHSHNRLDVIETNLKPAILEEQRRLFSSITESHDKFIKYQTRLEVVRQQKQADLLNYQDGEDFNAADGMYSEASSVIGQSVTSHGSRSSRSSGHSSKSRRKFQRKKYSLKEGSKNEEFALIEALAELTNSCNEQQMEISRILSVLLLYKFDNKCGELQNCFDDYVKAVEKGKDQIWCNSSLENTTTNNIVTGPQTSVNQLIAQFQQMKTNEQESDLPAPTQAKFQPQKWRLAQFDSSK